MGGFFFWMGDPPVQDILALSWTNYVNSMGAIALMVTGTTILAIGGLYFLTASRRKVFEPADLFAPYTPMYWLLLSILPVLAVGGVAGWTYEDALNSSVGQASTSLQMGLWSGLVTLAFSYALMLFPGITPAKFRYRPWWLFYRNKGVKA
jgi:hypothetical protein